MEAYKERLGHFEFILDEKQNDIPIIDLKGFRRLCFRGIPDKPGIRPKCWKLLMGYLPPEKRSWEKVLADKRATYYNFVRDLFVEPTGEEPTVEDHPLNSAPDSKWATFFQDNVILEQIDKDVRRTLPDFAFFQLPVPRSDLSPLSPRIRPTNSDEKVSDMQLAAPCASLGTAVESSSQVSPIRTRRALFKRIQHLNKDFGARERPAPKKSSPRHSIGSPLSPDDLAGADQTSQEDGDEEVDLHWEAIERILFIYAKLNAGVGYVQGMNEILGPIYYTMANDTDEKARAHAEADSFFVFTAVMGEIMDHFVRSLDSDANSGIGATMKRLNSRLKQLDLELWEDMERKSLQPAYYSFRWLTVLCSQEFSLPDVIRLWDSLFADSRPSGGDSEGQQRGFEFLLDFCCAMIICVREELIQGSFAENIKLLQNYPINDVAIVLQQAYKLRDIRLSTVNMEEPIPPESNSTEKHKLENEKAADPDKSRDTRRETVDEATRYAELEKGMTLPDNTTLAANNVPRGKNSLNSSPTKKLGSAIGNGLESLRKGNNNSMEEIWRNLGWSSSREEKPLSKLWNRPPTAALQKEVATDTTPQSKAAERASATANRAASAARKALVDGRGFFKRMGKTFSGSNEPSG
ncbi:uncharacterized protein VTP21DRAFT_9562 [Calcarisporiella thermophila]|uniref:uncharacterized protein n=1 Tax=Calcarisporiella thermophila TaxID=911321 RepID=UPI003742C4D8